MHIKLVTIKAAQGVLETTLVKSSRRRCINEMLVFSLARQEKHIIERQHYFMVIALHGSVIMCLERSGRN